MVVLVGIASSLENSRPNSTFSIALPGMSLNVSVISSVDERFIGRQTRRLYSEISFTYILPGFLVYIDVPPINPIVPNGSVIVLDTKLQ